MSSGLASAPTSDPVSTNPSPLRSAIGRVHVRRRHSQLLHRARAQAEHQDARATNTANDCATRRDARDSRAGADQQQPKDDACSPAERVGEAAYGVGDDESAEAGDAGADAGKRSRADHLRHQHGAKRRHHLLARAVERLR